ncbi:MAG: HlyD family type I secretion periplasmic adaptor subunit [Alphaproteobacteria bacterium]
MNQPAAPAPKAPPAKPPPKKLSFTGRLLRAWGVFSEKVDNSEAYLYSMFDTDDDMPLSRHLLLMGIAAFFVLAILWANLATVDEVTRGEGKVIPSQAVQAIQSLDAGIVEAVMVKEGEEVKAGQPLIRLSNIEASSDLGSGTARYMGLRAAVIRLQAEAEGKPMVEFPDEVMKAAPTSVAEELNAFRANQTALQGQMNVLNQQLAQREQEVRELESKANDMRGVISLQHQEMDMISPLVARGSAPKLELLQMERTIKEKTSELNSALASLPRAKSATGEVRAQMGDIKTTAQAQAQMELAAKLLEMNEIKEKLSALEDRSARSELKSPVNGTIQEIAAKTIGGVVRAGDDIIKIVPKDDQLIVEAKIKPSDRARIYPGQRAIVKVTAYDFSIYGGIEAEVLDISADTFEEKEQKGKSFYRVRLGTKDTQLKRNGEVLPIIPGMVATVDILTGKKTVMQYIMKPLIKTLENSLSER